MRAINYSFPHPVLGKEGDIDGKFSVHYMVEPGRDKIVLHVEIELNNKTIEKLIEDGKAEFVCDLVCANTLFRENKGFKNTKYDIELPSDDLRGKVSADFFVITKEDLGNYIPTGLNGDYKGFNFDIREGEVLAVDNKSSYFFADKTYEHFFSATSFIQVVQSEEEEGTVKYDWEDDKIIIFLPKRNFQDYKDIYTNESFFAVYHALLAYPALVVALDGVLSESNISIANRAWYQRILQLRENDDTLNSLAWEKENVTIIAQQLLKLPVGRSLSDIKEHIDKLSENY